MTSFFKNTAALLTAAVMCLSLCGCGMRQRVLETEAIPPAAVQEPEAEVPPVPEEPDQSVPSTDDPDSEIREYADDASGVIAEDAEVLIAADIPQQQEAAAVPEGPAPEPAPAAPAAAETADPEAQLSVTVTVPSDDAEKKGAADNENTAESAMQYYTALLDSRLGELFECQRFYIYWEGPEELCTVHKSSVEHKVILLAGAYDSSAKLAEDALHVDEGWVCRKDPGAIVKCIPDSEFASARPGLEAIASREGFASIDAVKKGRLIAIPESLMQSAAGQTAAAVYIACFLYPSLFSDVDPGEAAGTLLSEAGRTVPPAPVTF